MPRSDVIAVIPAYQCAVTLGEVVAGVREHVSRVVVVDDGSTDGSGEVARRAGARVLTNRRNRGKGHALRRGFAEALAWGGVAGEPEAGIDPPIEPDLEPIAAVAMIDGDGQHAPDDLPAILAAWDEGRGDLLVGARLKDREKIPPHRYWTNTIGSRLLSWITGVDLEDSQSGYRLMAADLLARLPLTSNGYAIESEMLIKAAKRDARIAHVRVQTIYHSRVPSFYRPILDTTRIVCASIWYRLFDRSTTG